ncbi:hypothetical protein [Sulfitobacter alexandrii]|nr:hypothetical protein [Sulfitobacter alexandrii]
MPTRRTVLGQTIAAGLTLALPAGRSVAQDRYDQAALLQFPPLGDITLLYYSDVYGMLHPHLLRPAAVRHGPDRVPNLTGEALRIRYGIGGRTPMDAAMTAEGFDALGAVYGPMGGVAHLAAVIGAVRAARPGTLVLDGGDSDSALVRQTLRPDAATFGRSGPPATGALAVNHQGQPTHTSFERGPAGVAVIGIADPHRIDTVFSLEALQQAVTARRDAGAAVVVVLSRLGFEADRAIASGIDGVDVIFSGRSGHALPEPEVIGGTRIVASGSQGRFVSRVDIAVSDGRLADLRHGLIPVFSNLIRPDAAVARRLPDVAAAEVGTAADMLHHLDTFSGTWEALIGEAMRAHTGAPVALIPPLRAAETVLPGQPILDRQIGQVAAGQRVVVRRLTGAAVALMLESAAEAVFAADPVARREARMMRTQGLSFAIAPGAGEGGRISDLKLLDAGRALSPEEEVPVALLGQDAGTPLEEALTQHVARLRQVTAVPSPVIVNG